MEEKQLLPNQKVIVTKNFDIHQDWDVPISGFYIIESLRKIKSIDEFSDNESVEFMMLLRKLRTGMRTVLGIKDVYLF